MRRRDLTKQLKQCECSREKVHEYIKKENKEKVIDCTIKEIKLLP